ncbi:cyclopropane-fatty-acyl-phospholipid synthase family protein [Bacteriovoracaceae bacterium]|nr:cyclopropane-fatty-acyl-phospholipid synthase family protein [Bacteriovoracaceae bacterium]
MNGDWETNDLTLLLRWTIQNIENSGIISGTKNKNYFVNFLNQINRLGHLLKRNTKEGSKNNISYHYDLSNKFYQMMLDETMSYSCGIFTDGNESLYESQINKLNALCDNLDIQSGDHILEIGCGWGGFAIHAVTNFDCKVTGVTISKEQYNFAKEKISNLGLSDKIEILLMDYRDIQGQFDKVVSIEMIEAVGHEFLPQYFQTIDHLLKPDGVAVIQAITSPDSRYELFRKGVDFIQKHIFPGTLLPSMRAMHKACEKTDLHLINLRDIGLSYAKTLKIWHDKVEEQKSEIRKLGMDDTFFNQWKYYLCYCEAAFAERNISDVQITFIKPNNTKYKYE